MWLRRTVAGLALAGLAVVAWLLLAPQQLGGPIAVVSTYGNSMLPTYDASDLVIVVKASSYEVGDVVAYPSDELGGAVVLHRIVDTDGSGYVTQGDNNGWLDPDRPTDDELMGTARLHVPAAGRLLEVPTPVRAAVVTVLAGLALFGGQRPGRRRSRRPTPSTPRASLLPPTRPRRRSRRSRPTARAGEARSAFVWVGWPQTTAPAASLTGVIALLLAVAAFSQPTSVPGEVEYTHRGTFDYSAEAPSGVVYPTGEVATGDPIFLRLVDQLEVSFVYELDGQDVQVDPSGQLWLELADGSGWSTRSPLGDEQVADDEGVLSLEGTLDVAQLRRTIDRVREQTGVGGGGGGTINVASEIEVAGLVAGQPVSDRFVAELTFGLEEARLVPQATVPGSDGAATDGAVTDGSITGRAGSAAGLTRSQPGSVTLAGAEPARFEFAGRGLEVAIARVIALTALAAALAALAIAAVGASRQRDLDEASRIRLRHGRRIVEVASLEVPAGYGIVDVREISALLSRAAAADRPVLHHRSATTDTYLVEGDAIFYRYRVEAPDADPPPPPGATASGMVPPRAPAATIERTSSG